VRVNLLQFTPRAELEPEANLRALIELCRQSDVFDARHQFDCDTWLANRLKGHNAIQRLIFSTLEAAGANLPEPSMAQPFLDFAKAAIIYLQDTRPVVSYGQRLGAFRCLEAALLAWNKGARPTAVNPEVLDMAVELARKQYSPGVAYRVAGQLQIISEFMRAKRFITLRQPWGHGLKKPKETGSRISQEALAARQSKLPSAATLRALAGIFHSATEAGDVVVSSYCALMLCAPERVNEALRMRRNCIVEGEGEFRGKLGLRWAGSKGFDNATKWLPTEMAPIAREAIERLLKVSAPAHELAKWYTANPKKMFIHTGARHLEGRELLTTRDIALLLWGDEELWATAAIWAKTTKKLESISLDSRRVAYRFSDVERVVLDMLPATFPYVPGDPTLLCEESIAVTRANDMSRVKGTYLCMFNCVSYAALDARFCTSRDSPSVFDRFGYTDDDGSRINFRTHALRHYLNTLAQSGGLSSAEIAIFSGRKDVRQNRSYDHMTSDEVQAPISEALRGDFTSELEPLHLAGRKLVTRSEFSGLGLAAAHTTEFGWCAHDFAAEPCQMHRDCVNCEEQECIKGDAHKESNLRKRKSETEYLLQQARAALNDDEYGADAWVKHQVRTLERIDALLRILEDPAVPTGARIRLDLANAPVITTNNVHPARLVKASGRKALT
jgi:hypothetical protein